MRIAALIISFLLFLGIVLRLMEVPGGIMGIFLFSLIFLLFFAIGGNWIFRLRNKENAAVVNVSSMSVLAGIIIGLSVLPILFRLLNWPSSFLVLVGIFPPLLIFCVLAFIRSSTPGFKEYYKTIGVYAAVLLLLNVVIFIIPTHILHPQYLD